MTLIESEINRLEKIILEEKDLSLYKTTLVGLPIDTGCGITQYDYYYKVLERLKKELVYKSIQIDYTQYILFRKFWNQAEGQSVYHCWITPAGPEGPEGPERPEGPEENWYCNFGMLESCVIL